MNSIDGNSFHFKGFTPEENAEFNQLSQAINKADSDAEENLKEINKEEAAQDAL
jgi:hypothetical protein